MNLLEFYVFSASIGSWRWCPCSCWLMIFWAVFIVLCSDFLSAAELLPYHDRLPQVRTHSMEQRWKDFRCCCERLAFLSVYWKSIHAAVLSLLLLLCLSYMISSLRCVFPIILSWTLSSASPCWCVVVCGCPVVSFNQWSVLLFFEMQLLCIELMPSSLFHCISHKAVHTWHLVVNH